jgi:hypothetical protein
MTTPAPSAKVYESVKFKFHGSNLIYSSSVIVDAPVYSFWKDVTNTSFWSRAASLSWNGTGWSADYKANCTLSLADPSDGSGYGTPVTWQVGYHPTKLRVTYAGGNVDASIFVKWANPFSGAPLTSGVAMDIDLGGLQLNSLVLHSSNSNFTVSKIEFYFDPSTPLAM